MQAELARSLSNEQIQSIDTAKSAFYSIESRYKNNALLLWALKLTDLNVAPKAVATAIKAKESPEQISDIAINLGYALQLLQASGDTRSAEKLKPIIEEFRKDSKSVDFNINLYEGIKAKLAGRSQEADDYLRKMVVAAKKADEELISLKEGVANTEVNLRILRLKNFTKDTNIPQLDAETNRILKVILSNRTSSSQTGNPVNLYEQFHYSDDISQKHLELAGAYQLGLARDLQENRAKTILHEGFGLKVGEKQLKLVKVIVDQYFKNGLPTKADDVTPGQVYAAAFLGGPLILAALDSGVSIKQATSYSLKSTVVTGMGNTASNLITNHSNQCMNPKSSTSSLDCGQQINRSFRALEAYQTYAREFEAIELVKNELPKSKLGRIDLVYGAKHEFADWNKHAGTIPMTRIPIPDRENLFSLAVNQNHYVNIALAETAESKILNIRKMSSNINVQTDPESLSKFILGVACGDTSCSIQDSEAINKAIAEIRNKRQGPFTGLVEDKNK